MGWLCLTTEPLGDMARAPNNHPIPIKPILCTLSLSHRSLQKRYMQMHPLMNESSAQSCSISAMSRSLSRTSLEGLFTFEWRPHPIRITGLPARGMTEGGREGHKVKDGSKPTGGRHAYTGSHPSSITTFVVSSSSSSSSPASCLSYISFHIPSTVRSLGRVSPPLLYSSRLSFISSSFITDATQKLPRAPRGAHRSAQVSQSTLAQTS